MLEIITEWFSMPLTFIVVFMNLSLFAAGLIAALKIKNKKTTLYVMLTEIALYLICAAVVKLTPVTIAAYAVFVGGVLLLSFAGLAFGLMLLCLNNKTCT